jgi:hypothetical protein
MRNSSYTKNADEVMSSPTPDRGIIVLFSMKCLKLNKYKRVSKKMVNEPIEFVMDERGCNIP